MGKLFTALVLLLSQNIYSQQRLSDTIFISRFKKENFNLNAIHDDKKLKWELVAGRCELKEYNRPAEEKRLLDSYIDSIKTYSNKLLYRYLFIMDSCTKRNYRNPHNNEDTIRMQENIYMPMVRTYDDNQKLIFQLSHKYEYLDYTIDYKYFSHSDFVAELKDTFLCNKGGFGTYCPPSGCGWNIIRKNENGISFINEIGKLKSFIGKVNNPSKAYILFMATQFGSSGGLPVNSAVFEYQFFRGKYYFIQSLRLSDCPVTNYKCLVEVDMDGNVKLVDKKLISQSDACI